MLGASEKQLLYILACDEALAQSYPGEHDKGLG